MFSKTSFCCIVMICLACRNTGNTSAGLLQKPVAEDSVIYKRIEDIPLPEGYFRNNTDSASFAFWLRHIELKKSNTVYLYNGTPKANQAAQFAVLNISVENKDLQQCADAVMRLRAEYLFANKKFDSIDFTDNEKTNYRFTSPYTREHFMKYLDNVFGMCGSASLSKQLIKKKMEDIQPGDVLIRGGFPGHAVMVMDVAISRSGKKLYLLAQSYMPAQDIHVLKNPMNKDLSPWYEVNNDEIIETPEYVFKRGELKTW
ncbi:DUF4846 domain-containing protein [Ferruginibacter albus]|uniref:DUF4846 domain-containing protein n=1 Tax=Ferruginibacter albus TaxID=2875540 RepID=UPI001CC66682|nr:DUF4846 domain-containing protein [Ferruginibacter albus]UAY51184.1 DUF4846 domain-containing protein [Ferruginibacter albus]